MTPLTLPPRPISILGYFYVALMAPWWAYNYARYIEHVTAAGRAEYNIPMITNVWLSGPDRKPGDWPSGCPEPQVLDIWMATAPHLDAFAPDIYSADFVGMANRYHRDRNPFFIVETSARPGPISPGPSDRRPPQRTGGPDSD